MNLFNNSFMLIVRGRMTEGYKSFLLQYIQYYHIRLSHCWQVKKNKIKLFFET